MMCTRHDYNVHKYHRLMFVLTDADGNYKILYWLTHRNMKVSFEVHV